MTLGLLKETWTYMSKFKTSLRCTKVAGMQRNKIWVNRHMLFDRNNESQPSRAGLVSYRQLWKKTTYHKKLNSEHSNFYLSKIVLPPRIMLLNHLVTTRNGIKNSNTRVLASELWNFRIVGYRCSLKRLLPSYSGYRD